MLVVFYCGWGRRMAVLVVFCYGEGDGRSGWVGDGRVWVTIVG